MHIFCGCRIFFVENKEMSINGMIDRAKLAKKYITNNVSLNLSVKDVADYVHLSPEYFTKLFKKEVGQNIKSYILQVKVEIAKICLEIQIFQSVWLL